MIEGLKKKKIYRQQLKCCRIFLYPLRTWLVWFQLNLNLKLNFFFFGKTLKSGIGFLHFQITWTSNQPRWNNGTFWPFIYLLIYLFWHLPSQQSAGTAHTHVCSFAVVVVRPWQPNLGESFLRLNYNAAFTHLITQNSFLLQALSPTVRENMTFLMEMWRRGALWGASILELIRICPPLPPAPPSL